MTNAPRRGIVDHNDVRYPHGFCCTMCGAAFKVGDEYARIRIEDMNSHPDIDVSYVVCLTCAHNPFVPMGDDP